MNENPSSTPSPPPLHPAARAGTPWLKIFVVVVAALLTVGAITVGSAAWWYNHNFNASDFKPVQLTAAEQTTVDNKVAVLNHEAPPSDPSKTIVLNEREINSFLKDNLGEKVRIHLTKERIGATFLVPLEQDAPLFGGSTVRVKVAFDTKLDAANKLQLSLADVSVGGISLPNAWLGDVKGVNLVDDAMHGPDSFLSAFAAGIKSFDTQNGELRIVLND